MWKALFTVVGLACALLSRPARAWVASATERAEHRRRARHAKPVQKWEDEGGRVAPAHATHASEPPLAQSARTRVRAKPAAKAKVESAAAAKTARAGTRAVTGAVTGAKRPVKRSTAAAG